MKMDFSRNFPIISSPIQKKIESYTIAFIGCGLGSNIALLAARTGFRNFVLVDGDLVDSSNLNRQLFQLSDVGRKKSEVCRKNILGIRSDARVKTYNKFVT